MTPTAVVIINPVSGGIAPDVARRRGELAARLLTQHQYAPEIFLTERPGHARELAAAASGRGARLVIAWGGDGTVNEVASGLAFGPAELGIVPGGSGNGLARELGMSRRPAQALRQILSSPARVIDAGDIDGRLFFNVAGVGFDACIAGRFLRSRRRGFLAYARLTLSELLAYRCGRYTVVTPDEVLERDALLVAVANSRQFGNGAIIAPAARLDDGLLDLVVVEERARWRTMCDVPRLVVGGMTRIPGVLTRRVPHASIRGDCPLPYHLDGEPTLGGTALEVRVRPGALRVRAPIVKSTGTPDPPPKRT